MPQSHPRPFGRQSRLATPVPDGSGVTAGLAGIGNFESERFTHQPAAMADKILIGLVGQYVFEGILDECRQDKGDYPAVGRRNVPLAADLQIGRVPVNLQIEVFLEKRRFLLQADLLFLRFVYVIPQYSAVAGQQLQRLARIFPDQELQVVEHVERKVRTELVTQKADFHFQGFALQNFDFLFPLQVVPVPFKGVAEGRNQEAEAKQPEENRYPVVKNGLGRRRLEHEPDNQVAFGGQDQGEQRRAQTLQGKQPDRAQAGKETPHPADRDDPEIPPQGKHQAAGKDKRRGKTKLAAGRKLKQHDQKQKYPE